jgi:hypothetical protein
MQKRLKVMRREMRGLTKMALGTAVLIIGLLWLLIVNYTKGDNLLLATMQERGAGASENGS